MINGVLSYVLGAIIIGLGVLNFTVSSELSIAKAQLAECRDTVSVVTVERDTHKASIALQNSIIEKAKADLAIMQANGKAAQIAAEADIEILEQTISDIRREPKGQSCEQIRQKLIRYAHT